MTNNSALQTVKIKDYTLDYLKFGNGEKSLIMIPGLAVIKVTAQSERRAKMAGPFLDEYTVYFPDRRPNLRTGATVKDMADDIADFMDALNIKSAVVDGFSQGGMIAQYLALNYPEKVEKLVLTVTLSRPNETIKKAGDWVELIYAGEVAKMLELVRSQCFSDEYYEKIANTPVAVPGKEHLRSADQYEICAKACLTCNSYDRLSEIKCPVLVVGGEKDCVVSGEASHEIAEKLNCDLYMYENMGHGLYEEDPDYCNKIKKWIDSH